jgi:glycosyltransferase involved in cell wall biosynthesis
VRIGVVTTSYPRYAGDPAGHFVAGLNRWLTARGHTIEVLAAGEALAAGEGQEARATAGPGPGIAVHRVPSPLFYRGGAPDALVAGPGAVLEAARFSVRLGQLLGERQRGYDALISHWLVPCGVLAATLGGGRPQVAIAHSSDIHLLRRLGLEAAARFVARRARLVYTTASLRVPGAPGVVVPMGIDTAEFRATSTDRAAARQRLGWAGPTVLFLGRLVPVKGVAVLLEALSRAAGAAGCAGALFWRGRGRAPPRTPLGL